MDKKSITSVDTPHHIQRTVLMQLRQNGPLGYVQLKPDGVEGNAFNYHVRALISTGLIRLAEGKYSLTSTGYLVADSFSYDAGRLLLRPHCYTHLLITQGDFVLVYVPTREPMSGRICLPSGKIHYGDSTEKSVQREMKRRGLDSKDASIQEVCAINVRYLQNGAIVMHRPGSVWRVDYRGERATSKTPSGEAIWMKLSELQETLPDIQALYEKSKSRDFRVFDFEYEL